MIKYEGVSKVFGSGREAVTALKEVTFEIKQGVLVTLLGPSGCVKTTLLRLTNRLLPLTSGTIKIDGQDIMSVDQVKLRQSMGYAIQQIGLFPNKTIYGNIAVVPRLLGWDEKRIRARVDELLRMLRLEPDTFRDRYPVELSGGQQQRIGVARCLAADPEILLMDEPFGAIDPINREEIQNEFLRVQAELKKTIVFVTHDILEAIKMGDKIAIFQEGRLIQYDTPEVTLTRPINQYIGDFVGTDRALKVLGLVQVEEAMNKKPKNIIEGSTNAQQALKFLEKHGFSELIVIDQGKPIGYVRQRALKDEKVEVKNIAKSYPVDVGIHDTLKDAMSHMLMHDMRDLSVINDNGDFLGTISYKDIREHILKIYTDDRG
jgi:osmoprotectant transport system ATP-binding protein